MSKCKSANGGVCHHVLSIRRFCVEGGCKLRKMTDDEIKAVMETMDDMFEEEKR